MYVLRPKGDDAWDSPISKRDCREFGLRFQPFDQIDHRTIGIGRQNHQHTAPLGALHSENCRNKIRPFDIAAVIQNVKAQQAIKRDRFIQIAYIHHGVIKVLNFPAFCHLRSLPVGLSRAPHAQPQFVI